MDNLISRQKVVDTVFSMLCRWDTEDPDDLKNMLLLAFQELPTASRWIPCSERLPDYDVEVLATTEWGGITIAERLEPRTGEKDYWWFLAEGNINGEKDDVIAWMPLPKAYKGEKNG